MVPMTVNSKLKKNSQFSSKVLKNEVEIESQDVSNFEKIIHIRSIKELNNIPVIPIAESGHGLQPPFNMRIQFNDKSTFTKETVNLNKIKGTVSDHHLIDPDFRPKREFVNKRFRKVWQWVHNNPNNNENVILPSTIILAKITEEDFYVVEGLRRVIALKFSNVKTVTALVVDYREVYNKILQRRKNIELQKKQSKSDIIHSNTNFKPTKPRIRPTPVIKGQPRK